MLGQERTAQGLIPQDIIKLLDLMWKFNSAFQSYLERASRQYQSRESRLLHSSSKPAPWSWILSLFPQPYAKIDQTSFGGIPISK